MDTLPLALFRGVKNRGANQQKCYHPDVFWKVILATILCAPLIAGCKRTAAPYEHYQVTSYDARTHEWTLRYTSTYQTPPLKRRIILVCQFYQTGKQQAVDGPDACGLSVGSVLETNLNSKTPDAMLDIFKLSPDTLVIMEGSGDDEVSQHFFIVKDEVLSR
ncbi:MAG: hypothetical protein WA374_01660 [Acidobacteriaceae bacterium]